MFVVDNCCTNRQFLCNDVAGFDWLVKHLIMGRCRQFRTEKDSLSNFNCSMRFANIMVNLSRVQTRFLALISAIHLVLASFTNNFEGKDRSSQFEPAPLVDRV